MFLFLDDERVPRQVTWDPEFPMLGTILWHIVRDIDEFKGFIDAHLPEITHIAFDHDLGPEHYPWNGNKHDDGRTGMDCAKYLVEQCIERNIKLPRFSVHSMNPAGRENIRSYLKNFRNFQQQN
jgi:hypothetical protein